MKFAWKGIIVFCILAYSSSGVYASKIPRGPDTAIGFGGSFGVYNAITFKGSNYFHPDFGYQGGLILEKMFSNRLGFHTGLWMTYAEFGMTMKDSGSSTDFTVNYISLSIPALLITSFNARALSLNLLTGFTFSQIVYSHMKYKDSTAVSHDTDILHYLNYINVSLTLGFNIRFRMSQFTDYFIGILGDFNCLELIKDEHNDDLNYMYNARAITGVMFRTDIFPVIRR